MITINDINPRIIKAIDALAKKPLRDHFAGLAMQGEIMSQGPEGRDIEHIAGMAYAMADAMIKAGK